jgi:hypothetical protein
MEIEPTPTEESTLFPTIRDEEGNIRPIFVFAGALVGTILIMLIYVLGFSRRAQDEEDFLREIIYKKD